MSRASRAVRVQRRAILPEVQMAKALARLAVLESAKAWASRRVMMVVD